MSNKNEVFEYLIDQLRQQVNKKDVTSFNVSVQISDLDEVKQVIHNLQQHIAGKDDEIRALKDRLRQQLPVVDVMGEIKRWSIDRSIVGRGIYTGEENAIIDTYIGMEHNQYKQQCEDLAREVQSLKNQLRDASAQIRDLHVALVKATGNIEPYKVLRKGGYAPKGENCAVGEHAPAASVNCRCTQTSVLQEQYGCRKEDTQECEHDWYFYDKGASMMCKKCGLKK